MSGTQVVVAIVAGVAVSAAACASVVWAAVRWVRRRRDGERRRRYV